MSVKLPDLIIGDPEPRPTLAFRLDQVPDGKGRSFIALMAKHSEDRHEQTLLELRYHEMTGVLEVVTRDIHSPKLAEVLNVEIKQGARVRFDDRSAP